MKLNLSTYNGTSITTYGAKIVENPPWNEARIIDVMRVNDTPAYGGKSFEAKEFQIAFTLPGAAGGTSWNTAIETIGKLFHVRDITLRQLVATDANDANASYYIECTPIGKPEVKGNFMLLTMWAADPVWKKVTATTKDIAVTAGAGTDTVANGGNVDCYPVISVTPTANAGKYSYRQHVLIYNNAVANRALTRYPLDIVSAGLDTATEIAAGRMLITGDDLRVLVNGVEVERWLGGINTANTKVWIVLDWLAKQEFVLNTALSATGDTVLVVKNSNDAGLKLLPKRGILLVENEAIAYTDLNLTTRGFTIADSGRGVKDTTGASHLANVTVRWIQYDIVVVYGNASAAAPVQTDRYKPCFSIANSTNTNWRYDSADSVFADLAGLRTGGWKPTRKAGTVANWYSGNQGTEGTDPVTDMGAKILSWLVGTVWKTENAQLWWVLFNPCGITFVSSIGEKYRYASTTPWPTARLWSSGDGNGWATEWTEGAPSTANTWEAWTHANEAINANAQYVQFRLEGAVNGVASAQSAFEVNLGAAGSTGVTIDSTKIPVIAVKARATNAYVDFTLNNTTTGEGLSYSFPLAANTTLTIDTETRQVTYQDKLLAPAEWTGSVSGRQEWLRLAPGNNTLVYADAVGGAVTVSFHYHARKNL